MMKELQVIGLILFAWNPKPAKLPKTTSTCLPVASSGQTLTRRRHRHL